MIARVTLELALRKEFDYSIPPELAGQIDVGSRVKVPFGHRQVMGCVTALVENSPHTNLRTITKVIGKQTLVTPKILKLAGWIGEYYCCPPEIALKSVLPEAVRKEKEGWREQLFVRALPFRGKLPKLTKRQQEIWKILEQRPEIPLQELLELAETTADTIRRLENKGLVQIASEISERDPYAKETILPTEPLPLNVEQKIALEKIKSAMWPDRAAAFHSAETTANPTREISSAPDKSPSHCRVELGSTLAEAESESPFFKKNLPVHKYSGSLPHWRQDNKLYFVTFRLNDSVAQNVLEKWKEERNTWLKHHPEPWSEKVRTEYHQRFTKTMEDLLDAGHGSCALARPEIGKLTETALRHFDGVRYELGDFVIMPNHVHVLVRPGETNSLENILQSWRALTAREANRILGTHGIFWRDESFDHIVRSEGQYHKIRKYIQDNPAKGRVGKDRFRLGCGLFVFDPTHAAQGVHEGAVELHSAEPAASSTVEILSASDKSRLHCRVELGSTFLLHGVTGSGKTEVYLQAIAHALEQGRGAIVLVPEISLTPQTVERFKARFSSGPLKTLVAVLHSHLSAGERHDEWHKIRQGRARIVIGARSAVFAPVAPLGLIIVDEEHEHSYKQEEAPRYHARDVAVVRGQMENAVVVLGTATPSLESFYNVTKGKYGLLELLKRADDKKMPVVRVIDMRQVARKEKGPQIFSHQLKEAITQRLEKKEQTILFLNRRGFATSMQCPLCGYVAACPNCSVSLTYHRAAQKLLCHICGHDTKAPTVCPEPKCRNPQIRYSGLGTEKVEATLVKLFPHAKIRRMDSDTLKRKEDYRNILGDFKRGKIDILVGTQMIAKGLHFPNVTLVGIIYADLSLHMPDFRAGERTFQLLTQVSGRAGRGEVEGEVFVQAFTPFHPAIQFARRHDFAGFYEQEIEFREQLKYPPISRVALLTVKGRNEEKVKFSAEHLRKELEKTTSESGKVGKRESENEEFAFAGEKAESPALIFSPAHFPDLIIAGPAPAPLARAETQYRYQIMLRTKQMTRLSQILSQVMQSLKLPDEVSVIVDIDPVNLS